MVTLLVWPLLLLLCWPLALVALILYPVVWLLLLPFRLVGITLEGVFRLLAAIVLLPVRLLRGPRGAVEFSRGTTAANVVPNGRWP